MNIIIVTVLRMLLANVTLEEYVLTVHQTRQVTAVCKQNKMTDADQNSQTVKCQNQLNSVAGTLFCVPVAVATLLLDCTNTSQNKSSVEIQHC